MNGCKKNYYRAIRLRVVYSVLKGRVSRRATRGASAGACREHAQVGPMIDVKGQSTWSAS